MPLVYVAISLRRASIRSRRVELAANLAAGEIARASVRWRDAVVRVHVDVRAATSHGGDELRERVAFECADEIRGGERSLRQHTVESSNAEWTSDWRGAREEPHDDRAIDARGREMDVCHERVVDVRRDELVVHRVAVVADAEDCFTLAEAGVRRILAGSVEMGPEVACRRSSEQRRADLKPGR